MTKLFIIGNGFDIHHGMGTQYKNFRNFLLENYTDGDPNDLPYGEIPYPHDTKDGYEYGDEDVVCAIVRLLDNVEGDEWRNLEEALGQLDYCDFLDDWELDEDRFSKDTLYNNEDRAIGLCGAVELITKYLEKWINTIKIPKTKIPRFEKLIDPFDDLFLTFNYTQTLEKLYNVQNICHIHGLADKNEYGMLYLGHGNDEDKTEEYQLNWPGAEFELAMLYGKLRKDTYSAYTANRDFFLNIKDSNIENIYSYGFSFSNVDEFYIEKICRLIDTKKATWHLSSYNKEEERANFAEIIKRNGFKGNFSTFNID